MRLIKMTGGLGNQMFIYVLYLRMKSRFPDTRIDLSDMQHYHVHYGYEMNKVFGLPRTAEVCMPQWVKKALEILCFRVILERHERGSLRHYDGAIRWPWVYYKGFYQNLIYFAGHEEEIRRTFTFDMSKVSERNRTLAAEMDKDTGSVALHIRRGDYLQAAHYKKVGCVCQLPYYQRAIAEMRRRVTNPRVFIFSEDEQWVRENLPMEDAVFVNWNRGEDSWQDMMLMSHCHHNIICNSTFSWWAAWLNGHDGKLVFCPDRWYADDSGGVNLCPEEWVRISTRDGLT